MRPRPRSGSAPDLEASLEPPLDAPLVSGIGAPELGLDARALESDERVTIASAPKGHPSDHAPTRDQHDEARTGRRATMTPGELPAPWLERLLALSNDLPIEEGERAVVRAVVASLASIVPDHAVGACLVSSRDAPEVIRTMPEGEAHRALGNDPTRIFPGYAVERIVPIGADGSTLHAAFELTSGDRAHDDALVARMAALLDRATTIAKRGSALAREHAHAMQAALELRAINAQMAQTEKLASLGQIAAGVVHELNNPLTSIVAYTDFLIRKVSGRGEAADTDEVDRLRRIAESAGRMLRFTRDLVSYARPSSEVPVQVSVHGVIDQALAFCEHVLNESGVRVERRFSPEMPQVRGKPEQLAQVFVNLVTNASHAMRAGGGELVIATEANGEQVKITVADNGHGISKEHLPSVFAPFFTTKGSGVGTGLGLTIVKSIVDGHDGTIDVESVDAPPESGTAFTITLPAVPR